MSFCYEQTEPLAVEAYSFGFCLSILHLFSYPRWKVFFVTMLKSRRAQKDKFYYKNAYLCFLQTTNNPLRKETEAFRFGFLFFMSFCYEQTEPLAVDMMKIIFFEDMRLEKYTYDVCECRTRSVRREARAHRHPNRLKTVCFQSSAQAPTGSPKMLAFLGDYAASGSVCPFCTFFPIPVGKCFLLRC